MTRGSPGVCGLAPTRKAAAAALACALAAGGCAGTGNPIAPPDLGDDAASDCPPLEAEMAARPVSGEGVSIGRGEAFSFEMGVCLDADFWIQDRDGERWDEFECRPQMRVSAEIAADGTWAGEMSDSGCEAPLPAPLIGYWANPGEGLTGLIGKMTAGAARTAETGGEHLASQDGERVGLIELPPSDDGRVWWAEINTESARELFGLESWWLDVSEDTRSADLIVFAVSAVIGADGSDRPSKARFDLSMAAGYRLGAAWGPGFGQRSGDEWAGAEGGHDLYTFTVSARWDWAGPADQSAA